MLTQFLLLLGLSPLEIDAIRLSLEVSVSAILWSLPFAILVAWILARKNFYGKSIVGGLFICL
ncbi:molybdate ABC transporter permease protein [Aggregatibacter aphrophilus]|uniref:Molybdate ABC transporter permease protein n=1 Tax=Aggregatibacter aphrophilus TaxID=732 RepID=A0A336N2V7_AGGAP|nr:molybdate ABC transporter permease protein [Aggregatibacter aphrophilus]